MTQLLDCLRAFPHATIGFALETADDDANADVQEWLNTVSPTGHRWFRFVVFETETDAAEFANAFEHRITELQWKPVTRGHGTPTLSRQSIASMNIASDPCSLI